MILVMIPFTILLNTTLFGNLYYSKPEVFVLASLITGTGACIDFIICGYIAVTLKQRFPKEGQVALRLTLMILSFFLITGLFLYSIFRGYETISFYGYRFNEAGFIWSFVSMCILNVFITFIQEGAARYESWRVNLKETDALKIAFRQSQLQGLKSQVNPHFLFNSLNSLSSLINEDQVQAEKFLNEMSKVYRYMLRNDEDQFVDLQTELSFVGSYVYLLKARYGEGLLLDIRVNEHDKNKLIAPLSLQVIIENALQQNVISKSNPLKISIYTCEDGRICIKNNLQPKIVTEITDHESGIDNLVDKYRLLNKDAIIIEEDNTVRTIMLPLIIKEEAFS